MSSFISRVLTAVVFVAVMIGGVYAQPYTFVGLFALITALSVWEYLNLALAETKSRRDTTRKILGWILGMLPFLEVGCYQLGWIHNEYYIGYATFLMLPIVFLAFVYELYTDSAKPFANIGILVLGMVYIGIPFALLILIGFFKGNFSPNIVFGLLALTWMNDTGAYLVGSQIGKHKLFPRISPGKTWEGSTGGVVVTFIIAYLLSQVFDDLRLVDWMILGAIVAIFGSIGDLVESMLKRSLNIKDSGTLLPGHGGLLDRFDAFIFLLPFAAAYLLLFA
ncbi:MAG: phosphatidate cytidylyltransferase [Bacteroidota bacterium]